MRWPLCKAYAVAVGTQNVPSVLTGTPEPVAAHLKVSGFAGAGNITVTIQHSPDDESVNDATATWYTLITFTVASGNTNELKNSTINTPRFGRVRVNVVATGTAAGNIDVVAEGELNWTGSK